MEKRDEIIQMVEKHPEQVVELFQSLEERELLKALGTALYAKGFLTICDALSPSPHHHPKLSPVMVGLKPDAFLKVLLKASEPQMETLRHEAVAEPLQHHLTLLFHAMSDEETTFTQELQALKERVATFDVTTLTMDELEELYTNFRSISKKIDTAIEKIDRALALAWNTDRPDLVDSFTELKEYYHNDSRVGLGHPKKEEQSISGLYAVLQQHLDDVFADVEGEPAIEALAKLSIWYVRDYAAVGLLPHLSEKEKTEIEIADDDNLELRDKLRKEAMSTLARFGLKTVDDFRHKKIYSKAMLIEFLDR